MGGCCRWMASISGWRRLGGEDNDFLYVCECVCSVTSVSILTHNSKAILLVVIHVH